MERTHTGAVHEELQGVGRTHIGEVCGGLSHMGGTPMLEQGKSVGRNEWQRQHVITPIAWEEEVENNRVKLSPGRREV